VASVVIVVVVSVISTFNLHTVSAHRCRRTLSDEQDRALVGLVRELADLSVEQALRVPYARAHLAHM
jgi:hypothetical protein